MDQLFEQRKQMIYEFICDEFYVPMKLKELAILLQVPKEQRNELKKVMDSLESEEILHVSSKGKYVKNENQPLVGTFMAHARGFGFVSIEGQEEDIFIGEDDINGAFHNDQVEIVITKSSRTTKTPIGIVVYTLPRLLLSVIGILNDTNTWSSSVSM